MSQVLFPIYIMTVDLTHPFASYAQLVQRDLRDTPFSLYSFFRTVRDTILCLLCRDMIQ